MDNKILKSNFIAFIVLLAIAIFVGLTLLIVKPAIDEYTNLQGVVAQNQQDLALAQKEVDESRSTLQQEEDLLKNIKTIFQATSESASDNLSMFGTMFDDVIQRIQQNGLMIRAIEYKMNPENDALYANFSKDYNICTLKFFLVGSYAQVKTLFNDLHNNFPYLIGLSKVNVLSYEDNTDYVLVDLSVTLYSKKLGK